MQAKWVLVLAALFCAGCDDPKPTGPSAGGETRITVIAPHPTIGVGGSQQLAVLITGPDGVGHAPVGPTVWRSSNEAVYAVWNGGVAVALSVGQATISADADGRTADITLRVEPQGGAMRGIQGRLTDFATGAPMGGVTLSFGVDALDLRTTTDGSGTFAVDVPAGRVSAAIDGEIVADLAVRVGGPAFRGDLLGNGGTCDSRYGVVADALSFQPVAGATVSLGGRSVVTGADGWYRIDLGCVYDPFNNSSTTFMRIAHPAYREFSRVLGRGIHGVSRIDAELLRP
jgi:hypothetical protein